MTSSRRTVEAFLTAFRLRDVEAAMTTVADDVTVTIHPLRVRDGGQDALRTLLTDIVAAFPDLRIGVQNVIEFGTGVGRGAVAEFKIEGTQAADFLDAINQEKHLDLDTAWRFTVDADLITGIEAYWCQNQLYRRLAVKRQDRVAIV